jgi:sigma-B regulation protein RsbU (phosphoserine phosphatase)
MVTAVLLSLNLEAGGAHVVTAGHPKVIRLCAEDGVARRVPGRGSPLGLSDDVRFATTSLPVVPGDRLFLYTDGVTSARHVDGPTGTRTSLGEEGLSQLVNSTAGLALDDQVGRIMEGVLRFSRYKQVDDMLLCGIEIPG